MNKRHAVRTPLDRMVKMHFFGDEVDLSHCEDISERGFFVRTTPGNSLDKGVVAIVTIDVTPSETKHYLAEVVRITDEGVGFEILEEVSKPD